MRHVTSAQLIELMHDLDGFTEELELIASGTMDQDEIWLKLEGIKALVDEYLMEGK